VESHLGQAYRKLGIGGRAELAAILREPAAKDRGTSP
jgi:DNA-binding CsgD family transcriptional regulator